MPVGSDPDFPEKQMAIRRGVEAAGLHVRFPDYLIANPNFIREHFVEQLKSASGVLADLSGERPSCYFEIGFAEALGLPIFLIAENGTTIHQSAFRHAIRHYSSVQDIEGIVFGLLTREEDHFSPSARRA